MKYEYTFRNTAGDYALFYLGNTYHSMMAWYRVQRRSGFRHHPFPGDSAARDLCTFDKGCEAG